MAILYHIAQIFKEEIQNFKKIGELYNYQYDFIVTLTDTLGTAVL